MAQRPIWGLVDNDIGEVICLFEADNLLTQYRDFLLRESFDRMTKPLPKDQIALTSDEQDYLTAMTDLRDRLLDLGYERWRADEINADYPRYTSRTYELWNSVPPNAARVSATFDQS